MPPVEMIIKGVFRRYERWNPVHPTAGAFWGIGVGIGCGVGWGPGFGPEVIGYVGAGCGVGFSVGFTLLGLGIGLPANYFFTVPYDAFMLTRSGALEIARSSGLSVRNVARDGWYYFGPHISVMQQRAGGAFSRFKTENSLENGVHLSNLKSTMLSCTKPIQNQIQNVVAHFFPPQRGSQD